MTVEEDYNALKIWFQNVAATTLGSVLPGLGEALSVAGGAADFACAYWLSDTNRKMTNLAIAMVPDATVEQVEQYDKLRQLRERLMNICDP